VSTAHSSAKGTSTSRPAFNTLQQQFTPKKPSSCAQGGLQQEASSVITSIDSIYLQTELLHLQLLYEYSFDTERRLNIDAMTRLESKFDRVIQDGQDVALLRAELAGRGTVDALSEWDTHSALGTTSAHI
jgi:hypothetical protein